MAAGLSVPYDRHGSETAHLIHNSWPRRPGEPHPREFNVSSHNIGLGVECNAHRGYTVPYRPAGQSERIHAYYKKTGTLQHRTEQGFRNTRGACTLTEAPGQWGATYGTMRKPRDLSRSLPAMQRDLFTRSAEPMATLPGTMRIDTPRSRSGGSRGSRGSHGGHGSQLSSPGSSRSMPSLAHASRASAAARHWNFEPLPAYGRTNETYGSMAGHTDPRRLRAAGKSETGFLDPQDLIKTLTRYD